MRPCDVRPLDPDGDAGRAAAEALAEVLDQLEIAVAARRRIKATRESVDAAAAKAA